jgi:protein phosphatase
MTVPHAPSARPATEPAPARKPRDDEIDVYGLTHPGKVRTQNQDHFLICTLRKQMVVSQTSLPGSTFAPEGERLALLMMVADGVGGGARGEEASRLALEAVSQYVAGSMGCYYAARSADDQELAASLQTVAARCHAELLRRGEEEPEYRGMATTLTLYLGMWPRAFLLQVGDSRCYLLRDGELRQITRDQTMAQELVDLGVLKPTDAATGKLASTLSSSIGGRQTAPVVSRVDLAWGSVLLLCSDGLTRHVPDERIRERLHSMSSARQVCEDLLQDALDGGGSDNITVIVRRAVAREV